jgi:hypothetical protein
MGVEALRSAYSDLADQMDRIERAEIIRCPVCGEFYDCNKFYVHQEYATHVFPICKECLLQMATEYDPRSKTRVDSRQKVIQIFSMFDMPFYESMWRKCVENIKSGNINRGKTAFQQMMVSIMGLPHYQKQHFSDSSFNAESDELGYEFETNRQARAEIKKLFGAGYTEGEYIFLQDQYDDWRARTQVDSKSQETYVVQICSQLLDIDKDRKAGKDVSNKLKTLDTLMNSANLQPKQNVNNAAIDSLTMGQMIEKFENERPIPEPDPEFRDVNRIGKYIRVWFSGWLAKAMGFKNVNTKECEDYIKQYQVENPSQVQDEESEEIYSTLFGKEEG